MVTKGGSLGNAVVIENSLDVLAFSGKGEGTVRFAVVFNEGLFGTVTEVVSDRFAKGVVKERTPVEEVIFTETMSGLVVFVILTSD